ncbi:MAG: hypothetical protein GY808_09940 [Gammaproteobacteria bacterium]|nr:hypothetical protein [Gammaproteobacteria bacterium]
MGKRIRKFDNTPSEILAHLIQGIEAKMLRVAIKLYEKDIALLQHDGFASKAKLDKHWIIEQIAEQTGFAMGVSEEQIQVDESVIFEKREPKTTNKTHTTQTLLACR